MITSQVQKALSRLYRILEAGEKGFATAATNANNRGLKLLFKSFAQQRANFKNEILSEIRRLGGDCSQRSSLLAIIHRGRVAIFAAMTIEDDRRERVVLREAALGERFAAQTYQRTLEVDLPPETRQIVLRQYEEVQKVIEQIHMMLGKDGKRLIVRLFDNEPDAELAIQSLTQSGFSAEAIEKAAFDQSMELYQGKGTTVLETIFSGVFGGMVWGSLIGVLAGIGAVQTSISEWIGVGSVLGTWLLVALSTFVLAALVGGMIGLVIGSGIAEDDTYEYRQSILHGRYLIRAVVDAARANEAGRIMDQIIHQPHKPVLGVSA